jgi:3-phenylpropionate/trans-cinnamate dioxygenase ferredoxin subunit
LAFEAVATVNQLPPGERIVVEMGERYIAVFNVDGNLYAIEDVCTHDGGPLGEGELLDDEPQNPKVECERHGATFELTSGKPTFPAVVPVDRFPVKIEGDNILVDPENPL